MAVAVGLVLAALAALLLLLIPQTRPTFYQFKISFTYARRKLTSLLAVGGVTVAVMVLIVVLSVMRGFDKELRSRVRGTLSHIEIQKRGTIHGFEDYQERMAEILKVRHVAAAAPFIRHIALARMSPPPGAPYAQMYPDSTLTVSFKAINPELESQVTDLKDYFAAAPFNRKTPDILNTEFASPSGGKLPAAVCGLELVRVYRKPKDEDEQGYNFWPEGSLLVLVTATEDVERRLQRFYLAGTFKSGMFDFDNNFVYIPLDAAQRMLDTKGVTGIGVKLDDYRNADPAKMELERVLGPDYSVKTWEELRWTFLTAVKLERIVQAIILFFLLLVAGFCIMAILSMTVFEKRRDIGILKSIGVPSAGIRNIFLMNGLYIGVIGSVLGVACGMAVCSGLNPLERWVAKTFGFSLWPREVYYFDEIPVDASALYVVVIAVTAILISLLSSLLPAWRASRLDPIETLRFE
ncbi:MAG TPA: ABC transporter permease [Candidatus Brocadiia bacterium]|nr:ABC transporter permease [Candidatus Brocadiia bacterium]